MSEGSGKRGRLATLTTRGLAVSASSSINVAFFFARNIMLARVLGPADFGIAIAILTISSAIDVVSDMGWDKFLIQWDQKGHTIAEAQGVVHLLRLGVGLLMSVGIVLLSTPLAHLLDVPHAAGAIAALAAPVMLRSAMHIDYKYGQRDLKFGGEALVESSRSIVDLAVAVSAAVLLHSYWAMTLAITGGAFASFVMSHILARQRAWPLWRAGLGMAILAFGAPLVVNNVLVYIAGQGDRLLVGIQFGVQDLAIYGAALTLIAGPQAVVIRGLMMVALPILVKARSNIGAFQAIFAQLGATAVGLCALVSVPIILFGPELVHLAFGEGFPPDPLLSALLAMSQGLNILRTWAIGGLVANAHTKVVPLANIFRISGFATAILAASMGATLEGVAACLLGGELLGVAAALWWHGRLVHTVPVSVFQLMAVLAACWLAAGATQTFTDSMILRAFALAGVLAVNAGLCFAVVSAERRKSRTVGTPPAA